MRNTMNIEITGYTVVWSNRYAEPKEIAVEVPLEDATLFCVQLAYEVLCYKGKTLVNGGELSMLLSQVANEISGVGYRVDRA